MPGTEALMANKQDKTCEITGDAFRNTRRQNRACRSAGVLFAAWVLVILLALSLVSAVSCGTDGPEDAEIAGAKEVRVHTVQSGDVSDEIESFGTILFTRKSDVASAVEGNVVRISFREGDRVRKGQLVASLSNPQFSIRRDQAEAAVDTARAAAILADTKYSEWRRKIESLFLTVEMKKIEIDRSERLLELAEGEYRDKNQVFRVGGIAEDAMRSALFSIEDRRSSIDILRKELAVSSIGLRDEDLLSAGYGVPADAAIRQGLLLDMNSETQKAELDVALANERSALIEYESALALISELTLESPIDGVVGALYKEPGERVEEGERVLTVFGADDAWVAFPVNEHNLSLLKPGMEALITVDAIGGESIKGTIDIISPTVDPQSGNVTVKALVRDPGSGIRAGMFARIRVVTDNPIRKILIPLSCIVRRTGVEGVVMAVRAAKVFRRNVRLGAERGNEIEILEGLRDGEIIVLEPTPLLGEGDDVAVCE